MLVEDGLAQGLAAEVELVVGEVIRDVDGAHDALLGAARWGGRRRRWVGRRRRWRWWKGRRWKRRRRRRRWWGMRGGRERRREDYVCDSGHAENGLAHADDVEGDGALDELGDVAHNRLGEGHTQRRGANHDPHRDTEGLAVKPTPSEHKGITDEFEDAGGRHASEQPTQLPQDAAQRRAIVAVVVECEREIEDGLRGRRRKRRRRAIDGGRRAQDRRARRKGVGAAEAAS